jgi:hypothetical protein
MRGGSMEDKRGYFVTLLSLAWLGFTIYGPLMAIIYEVQSCFTEGWTAGNILSILFFLEFLVLFVYPYFKYGIHLTRLELFTTRYLLVRFNRVTRQVYLHRPGNCGGVIVQPWEGVEPGFAHGMLPLVLMWKRPKSENQLPDLPNFVGAAVSDYDQQAEWEFVRRYMDEGGLSAVEMPKISSMFPWPWHGFVAQFEGTSSLFENANAPLAIGTLLMLPVYLLFGTLHWISLLLCWKPRWPKVIREAGQPGKPIPEPTTIDDYPPRIAAQLKANRYRWQKKDDPASGESTNDEKDEQKTGEQSANA